MAWLKEAGWLAALYFELLKLEKWFIGGFLFFIFQAVNSVSFLLLVSKLNAGIKHLFNNLIRNKQKYMELALLVVPNLEFKKEQEEIKLVICIKKNLEFFNLFFLPKKRGN